MIHLPLPLVIMAGGKSSRMGSDKALLPFGAFATLTEFQMNRLQPHFETLHVSCKSRAKFAFEASFIEDISTYQQSSPLIALLSILEYLRTPVCVLSVDTPFVTPDVFQKLYHMMPHANSDAVIARSPFGSHPLCAIYAPSITPNIKQMLQNNEHKIGNLLHASKTMYVDFEEDTPFFNVNHPEEYTQAKGLL